MLKQSSVELKHWHRKIYVMLRNYPTQQNCFTVVINEEKAPGFCLSLQQASVSNQPHTYLPYEGILQTEECGADPLSIQ